MKDYAAKIESYAAKIESYAAKIESYAAKMKGYGANMNTALYFARVRMVHIATFLPALTIS